jgi:hypothetical protein
LDIAVQHISASDHDWLERIVAIYSHAGPTLAYANAALPSQVRPYQQMPVAMRFALRR